MKRWIIGSILSLTLLLASGYGYFYSEDHRDQKNFDRIGFDLSGKYRVYEHKDVNGQVLLVTRDFREFYLLVPGSLTTYMNVPPVFNEDQIQYFDATFQGEMDSLDPDWVKPTEVNNGTWKSWIVHQNGEKAVLRIQRPK